MTSVANLRTRTPPCRLSVVVPCYNEQDGLAELHRRVTEVCRACVGDHYEFVLVNDGSRDGTWARISALTSKDPRVIGVSLSRNYGHQLALSAGLGACVGERILIIDADLQDPPELILEFARHWRAGYDVVYAVRETREGETRFKRATASAFYRAFNRLSEIETPLDVGDFRLVDRRAVDVFQRMRESSRFVRGMFSWIGLEQTGVVYHRERRLAGDTKYPLRKMIRFAVTGLISFSNAPLRAALNLGFVVSAVSFALGIWRLIVKLTGFYNVPGWTSIVVITSFLGGIQLIVLGVIGEYIGDIHAEVKQRPLYVIEGLENFATPPRLPPRAVVVGSRSRVRADRVDPLESTS